MTTPEPRASVVLLTGTGPEHRFVAHQLHTALGSALDCVILTYPERVSASQAWRRATRRYSSRQMISRLYWKVWYRATGRKAQDQETIRRTLWGDGPPPSVPDSLTRWVPDHNGPEARALLLDLRPRILAVYGTDIIRPAVIEMAGELALNMHTGISPRYRGADSVFWALFNEEPEWIGSTVHLLEPRIDAGPIFGTARPKIDPEDDEAILFAKCVRVGARLYVDCIKGALAGGVSTEPQDLSSGRQYRFVDRTVSAERRVARLLRSGLLRRVEDTE
jgi:methionyl-tRNA formyltransferase